MPEPDIQLEFSADLTGLAGSVKQLFREIVRGAQEADKAIEQSLVTRLTNNFKQSAEEAKKAGLGISEVAIVAFAAWEIGGDIIKGVIGLFKSLAAEVTSWVKLALAAEQADVRLEESIRAAGRGAEFTTEGLTKLAKQLENATNLSEETIKGVLGMQMKFKEVKGDEFDRMTEAALNMSVKMGIDAVQAANALGLAMQNPERGAIGLTRAGVKLTDSEKELAKHFKATGEVIEAQRLILGKTEAAMGNMARTAAATVGGGLQQLQRIFSDIKKDLGQELLPAIEAVLPAIKFMAEQAALAIKDLAKDIAAMVAAWAGSFDQTPAEALVGAIAVLTNETKKWGESLFTVAAGYRSILLLNKEINALVPDTQALGASHNRGIRIAFHTEQQASLQAKLRSGDTGVPGTPAFESMESIKSRLHEVTVKLKELHATEDAFQKKQRTEEESLIALRKQAAKDDARLREGLSDLPSNTEAAKSAIVAFRESILAQKQAADRLEAAAVEQKKPRVVGPEELSFSALFKKFNLGETAGGIAKGTAANLVPAWAEKMTNSLISIAGGKDTAFDKITKATDEVKGFIGGNLLTGFKSALGWATEDMDKRAEKRKKADKPFEANIENFQSLFQRIQSGAASATGENPAKRTAENTRQIVEHTDKLAWAIPRAFEAFNVIKGDVKKIALDGGGLK